MFKIIKETIFVKKNMTKDKFYQKLKNSNKNPVFTIHALSFVSKDDNKSLFTLGGISKRHTIHCNETGYWSTYDSDRYGFNNPDSEWDKNNIDFLLIGDSLVHGSCVDAEYNIAGILRKISNGNVLILANRGSGPLIQYAYLREYLKYIQPKRVIWFYVSANDDNDLLKELKNKYLLKYLEDRKFSQNLASLQQTIDEKLLKINDEMLLVRPQEKNRSNFLVIIKDAYKFTRFRIIIGNMMGDILPRKNFKKILNLSKNLAEQKGAKFYFVYHPHNSRYSKNYNMFKRKNPAAYDGLITLVKNLNIPIIDLHQKIFKNHPDLQTVYPPWQHPNKNAIFDQLLE